MAAAAALPRPLWAEAAGESPLLADLSRLPAAALQRPADGPAAEVIWADLTAIAAQGLGDGTWGPWARLTQGFGLEYLSYGGTGGWGRTAGFIADEVRRFTTLRLDGAVGASLVLDAEAAARAPAVLQDYGYAAETRDGLTALVKGGMDNASDLAARDPANPFGGPLGRASRVRVDGDRLDQASTWPLLAAMTGTAGPQGHADLAGLAAALTTLEAMPLQAMVLADPFGLTTAPPGSGIAPWRLALLADVFAEGADHALALFSYDTAALAADSAARIAALWQSQPMPDGRSFTDVIGPLTTGTAAGALPVAWARVTQPRGETAQNLAYRRVLQAMMRGELTPFAA